ncbi:hypothetical protein GCM10008983_07950 [Lentibacillus halophilus]|uniref:D-3-phosphoglycerate dehydrogenase n=1 Tax=Lentibacillus halophilus TaxID=295065 RepID=A0ABN0Z5S5_9BACI
MNSTIYIPLDIEKEGKDYLEKNGYRLKFAEDVHKSTLIKDVENCDAILTRSNAIIDEDVIKAGKNLKIISKYGVGINNINVDIATDQGIYVTSTPEANANVVAEHVLAFMLALSKRITIMDEALKAGNFDIRQKVYSDDLEGKNVGVIGLGRIGKLVAEKAHYGFNMNVLGYDPYVTQVPEFVAHKNELEDILQESDFISLHLPKLTSTKHIISSEQFNIMKKNAFFINASRGGTVDESALLSALKNKTIAGAGIDVFEQEPPNTNNELFSLENIIVTPHSAALSKEGARKMSLHAAKQIDQVLKGYTPSWPVNTIN